MRATRSTRARTLQARNAPSPTLQAVVDLDGYDSASRARRRRGGARSLRPCERTRGSAAGRGSRREGSRRRLASSGVSPVTLGEGAELLGIEPVGAHVWRGWRRARLARQCWSGHSSIPNCSALLMHLSKAHPGHDLGEGEVAGRSPHLPQPVVRLAPGVFEVVQHALLHGPGLAALRDTAEPRLVKHAHHLAVDVELDLAGRGVADPDGFRALRSRAASPPPIPSAFARPRART